MTIYVLHGYTDGLIDPIPSTDYEEVYAAMKAAYEEIMANVEPDDPDREYCFLEGWSATADQMILTGNTVFWRAGLLLLSCMGIGWNGRLRNWR